MAKYGPTAAIEVRAEQINAANFWRRVARKRKTACWLWAGTRNGVTGYGTVSMYALRRGPIAAHRIAYALHYGVATRGMSVCHTCDNPPCVNPHHLFLGTAKDNMRDMVAKGRAHWQQAHECQHGKMIFRSSDCAGCMADMTERRRGHSRHNNAVRHRAIAAIGRSEFNTYYWQHIAPRMPSSLAALAQRTDARRAEIVARWFGVFGFTACTLEAMGQEYGLTRERVRQLRNHALRRIGVTAEAVAQMPRVLAWKAGETIAA